MARKAKQTQNGLTFKKDKYRRMQSEAQKKSRRRKRIACAVAAAAVVVGILYYVFGGAAPHQTDTLATGQQYTAVIQRGKLYTFGSNNFGQLGLGSEVTDNYASPMAAIQQDAVKVACGFNTTYVITSDGTLYGWGANEYAQLGDGTTTHSSEPVKIMDNVADVAAGTGHVLAVTTDGSVYAWGSNEANAVGEGYGDVDSDTEDPVKCQSSPVKIMDNARSVSAGNQTSYVVTSDNVLYVWGLDQYYQLGMEPDSEETTKYYTAAYVKEPTKLLDDVAEVSAGRHMSALALTTDGTVYAWGNNVSGAVGCGEDEQSEDSFVKEPVAVLDGCAAIASGNGHSLAIKKNGDLYAWGSNAYQQLGLDSVDKPYTDNPYQTTPKKVRGGVAEVASNGMHTIIRTKHGSLITFGNDAMGQCGTGSFKPTEDGAKLAIVG